jgi:hypothetical protein
MTHASYDSRSSMFQASKSRRVRELLQNRATPVRQICKAICLTTLRLTLSGVLQSRRFVLTESFVNASMFLTDLSLFALVTVRQ